MFKIYCKNDSFSLSVKQKIIETLKNNNLIISNNNYKYVISIGGDGTFLETVHNELNNEDICYIPINTGHLGFYTEQYKDFCEIIATIEKHQFDNYLLLEVKTGDNKYLALNEFSIQTATKSVIFDYYIDDQYLQTLRGGGIIVCTPQGSTAQSKSFNGAVMYPNTNTFQVLEISSVNNSLFRTLNSPIILSKDSKLKIVCSDINLTTLNGDINYNLNKSKELEFKLSSKQIKVLHLKKSTFTKRIIDGFIK